MLRDNSFSSSSEESSFTSEDKNKESLKVSKFEPDVNKLNVKIKDYQSKIKSQNIHINLLKQRR